MVKKLNLETIPHPKPYPLGWICKDENLQVSNKCILHFATTAHSIDTFELDVVPLDIIGMVLGSPYLYDMKAIFHRHEKKIPFIQRWQGVYFESSSHETRHFFS